MSPRLACKMIFSFAVWCVLETAHEIVSKIQILNGCITLGKRKFLSSQGNSASTEYRLILNWFNQLTIKRYGVCAKPPMRLA